MWLLGISLSTFVGGVLIFILGDHFITNNILGILLGITLGMVIYIILLEFIPHIKSLKNKKDSIIGILSGIIILLLSQLF